jgi:hypothetical protein
MGGDCYETIIQLPSGMDNPSIPAYELDSKNRISREEQYDSKLAEWNRYNDFHVKLTKKIVSECSKIKAELDTAMYHISYGIRTRIRSTNIDLDITEDRTMNLENVWNMARIGDNATPGVTPVLAPVPAIGATPVQSQSRRSRRRATPTEYTSGGIPTPIRQSSSSSSSAQTLQSFIDSDEESVDQDMTHPLRTPSFNITSMTPRELQGLAPVAVVTATDDDRNTAILGVYAAVNRACIKLMSYHEQRVTLGHKPSKWYKNFEEVTLPPKPVLDIDSELEGYDMKVAIKWAKSVTRLYMSSGLTDQIIKTKMESILTSRYDDDDWKRDQFIAERVSTHNKEMTIWYQRQKVHDERTAAAIRIFSTVIGPSATQHVSELLKKKAFREAWCKLNYHYSTQAGGEITIASLTTLLSNIRWNSGPISEYMCQFEEIINQLIDAGEFFTDAKRIAAFQNGIERGSVGAKGKSLSDDINGMIRIKFNYNDIVHEIQRITNVDMMRKKEVSFQQSQSQSRVVTATVEKKKSSKKIKFQDSDKKKRHCTSCGQDGHLADKCWKDEICTGCGGIGHIEAFCESKQSSSSSSSSSAPESKVTPKLTKLFTEKNPTK